MDETITTGPQAESENPPDQPGQRRFLLWQRLSLVGILLIAVFMDFFQLGANGFGSYYPPAVRSMMDNWHNFFFAAYDPGAFVTIDKPPVGFWLQVASAKIFGFNAVSILAPQALAGVLSVLLLYYLVRRHFGVTAGLLAALALALSPISVVTNRNITIDSTLALTLLVGAWAVLRAAETGKLRWLLLSALIVGIGFNIKMLEAYLVVPAYAVLYLVTAPRSIWVRIGHLSLAGLLLVVVSLSWVVAVDLTPTSQRPYVDSTQDNSEISLAFGYNGLERLLGMGGPSGTKGGPTTIQGNATQQPQPSGGTPVGIFVTSAIGPLRLFEVQIGSQAGWLLPLALLGMLALAWQPRQNVREDRKFQSLVFWGTWLLTMGIYFSVASGILHQWYLTVMAPAIAAFFGIGLVTMWQDYRRGGWRGWLLPVALAATAAEQIYLLSDYPTWGRWMIPLIAALGIVVIVALVGTRISRQLRDKAPNIRFLLPALGIGVVALLFAPTVWAVTPIFLSTQADTLLAGPPQTGDNGGGGFVISTGSQTFTGTLPGKVGGNTATNNDALIRYLEANQGNAKFLVAVPNSQGIGDQIILATNKPVMSLGGFSNDPILTTGQLAALVKNGTVRFFLLQSVGLPQQILNQIPEQYRDQLQGGPGPNSALSTWVTQHCKTVPASLWQSTSTGSTSGGGSGNGNGNQLYDCATTH